MGETEGASERRAYRFPKWPAKITSLRSPPEPDAARHNARRSSLPRSRSTCSRSQNYPCRTVEHARPVATMTASSLALRLGRPRRPFAALGIEDEDLGGLAVSARVDAAVEGPHDTAGDLLNRLAERLDRRVLEEHPRVAQPLVLAQGHEVALRRRERVLEDGDDRVGTGPVRPRGGRSATELLLVEPDHRVRDLRQSAGAALFRRLLFVGGHKPPLLPFGLLCARAEGQARSVDRK